MRRVLFLSLLVIGQYSYAQRIDVKSVQVLKGTERGGYFHPVFSPKGTYLLTTAENYAGLKQHAMSTNKIETLTTDAGAGYGVRISPDENTILFKKTEMRNNLRYSSLQSYSLSGKKQRKLAEAVHEKITPVFAENKPAFIKGQTLMKFGTISEKVSSHVNVEDRKMVLYAGNSRSILTPNGEDKSYFWASVSPDGNHIVYTVAAYGSFVCDINGKNVVSLGKLNAPKWLNNQWVIGMNDRDDGDRIIASEIVAVSADGLSRQTLETPLVNIAMYPVASANGKQIAFNSEKGQIYIMNVELKN
jgi:Tol biopolymer transport system component